jgi:GNAT superfamily N-acetyltransferase
MTLPHSQPSSTSPHPPPREVLRVTLPPLEIVIRTLHESDVRLLEWHGGEDLRSFYDWQWTQHCNGEREVLVADFNAFPIGQVALQWAGKSTHPQIPDIQSLRVMETFRGLGIGSRLIEACEQEVLQRGSDQIGIAVGIENPAAQRLYERLGYRIMGAPYNDSWDYVNARGETILVEETIMDLIKTLPRP